MKIKKLIPSIFLLLLSASLLGTSTFAWFSMNRTVTVTGMQITTKVGSNLLIYGSNGVGDDPLFTTTLTQSVSGRLEPVSTIDGEAFYYTAPSNVASNGSAIEDDAYILYSETTNLTNTAANKTAYSADFQTKNGISTPITTSNVVYGYVDYVFYLKATNAEDSAKEVRMTECNLLYDGAVVTEKAWRVAMFSKAATKEGGDPGNADLVAIEAMNGAVNFTSGKAVSDTDSVDTVIYGDDAVVGTVSVGNTNYFKVVVRIWLEGEDTTCNNETFAALTELYTLDLAFSIDNTISAVTEIGSIVTP